VGSESGGGGGRASALAGWRLLYSPWALTPPKPTECQLLAGRRGRGGHGGGHARGRESKRRGRHAPPMV